MQQNGPAHPAPVRRDGGTYGARYASGPDVIFMGKLVEMISAAAVTRRIGQRRARTKASSCSATLAAVGMEAI
jgi:hypothetical protein